VKIKNDNLHSFFVKLASHTLLQGRAISSASWEGSKCACISFDCDFPEDMLACNSVIDILKSKGTPASFAIPGHLVVGFPEVINRILTGGYEVMNHTFSHLPNFRNLDHDSAKLEIEKFQDLMVSTYQYKPKGFRSPHGFRKIEPALFDILKENGMYDSSLLGFGPSKVFGVLEIPLTPCPDHPLMAFDSYHHFRFPFFSASEKRMLGLWKLLLEQNVFVNIFLDPIDFASNKRFDLLNQMINTALSLNFDFIRMDTLFSNSE
jgi:peptidoglycan/xylan/chitin deacetylase (PgdA/CDA1 family)